MKDRALYCVADLGVSDKCFAYWTLEEAKSAAFEKAKQTKSEWLLYVMRYDLNEHSPRNILIACPDGSTRKPI